MPSSVKGTVIDVQVFTRDGVEKDARARDIEEMQLDKVRKDLNEEYRIVEGATFQRLRAALIGKKASSSKGVEKGQPVTDEMLDELPKIEWFKIRMMMMR